MEDNKEKLEVQTEEQTENTEPTEKKQREFRGLYKYVKVSVRTLDIIIGICIAVIIVAVFIGLRNPGFIVTFDSKGGTDIDPQRQTYGEYLDVPEEPTREGYEFTGWYLDYACDDLWEDTDRIEDDLTLYAGWEPITSE